MRFDKHFHHQFVDGVLPERDPLVAILRARAHFHSIQRALAGQRHIHFFPTRQNAEDRVFAQLLVIVSIFVTQRQTIDSLRQHLRHRVLDPILISTVEKTLSQTRQQVQAFVGLAQQERSSIGTDRSAVETGHDLPPPRPFKSETRLVTLCHSDGRPFLALTAVWKLSYATEDGHLPIQREKCGLGGAGIQPAFF